jgi:hypothetical protein
MNRAWIPAGALAGVSVAGLIALGPLTSSLTSQPSFQQVVTVSVPQTSSKAVRVDYNITSAVGKTSTGNASLKGRGGEAAGPNSDIGEVAVQIKKPPTPTQTSRATAPPSPPAAPAKPVKKAVKRQASIGAVSGPNGDSGLAGSNPNGPTRRGEQQSTPAGENP